MTDFSQPTQSEIFQKIKKANVVGRGGGAVPAHLKWARVGNAPDNQKYVVCNGSEGEPGVLKDLHVLQKFLPEVLEGMRLAVDFLKKSTAGKPAPNSKSPQEIKVDAYFYINRNYHQQIKDHLEPAIEKLNQQGYNFKIFVEEPSYLGGERNALMSAIEGKRTEPTLRFPSPSVNGIHGHPTLVQNVETFYNVTQASKDEYHGQRFATINGKTSHPGIHQVDSEWTIQEILQKTNNWPDFDFFVQVGGSAAGVVLNSTQIQTEKLSGSGSIDIIPSNTNLREFIMRWFDFYSQESCGKCTPCREGTYQIFEMVKASPTNGLAIPWPQILKITHALKKSSFCGLGVSAAVPLESLLQNVILPKIKS